MIPIFVSSPVILHPRTFYIPLYRSTLLILLDKCILSCPVGARVTLQHVVLNYICLQFHKQTNTFTYHPINHSDEENSLVLPFVSSDVSTDKYVLTHQDMQNLILNVTFPFSRIRLSAGIDLVLEMDHMARTFLKYDVSMRQKTHVGYFQARPSRIHVPHDKFVIRDFSMLLDLCFSVLTRSKSLRAYTKTLSFPTL